MDLNKINWAVNRVKLGQALSKLESARKLNPALPEITEEALKAQYLTFAGLLMEDKPEVEVDPLTKAVKAIKRKKKDE